jgi:hypothetical protein
MQEEALKTKLVRNNILTAMKDEGRESEVRRRASEFVGSVIVGAKG